MDVRRRRQASAHSTRQSRWARLQDERLWLSTQTQRTEQQWPLRSTATTFMAEGELDRHGKTWTRDPGTGVWFAGKTPGYENSGDRITFHLDTQRRGAGGLNPQPPSPFDLPSGSSPAKRAPGFGVTGMASFYNQSPSSTARSRFSAAGSQSSSSFGLTGRSASGSGWGGSSGASSSANSSMGSSRLGLGNGKSPLRLSASFTL